MTGREFGNQELPSDLEGRIKKVLVERLRLKINPSEIDRREPIFDGGFGMDSEALMELIVGLEDEFEFQVADDDLNAEMFSSVDAIARYVLSNSP